MSAREGCLAGQRDHVLAAAGSTCPAPATQGRCPGQWARGGPASALRPRPAPTRLGAPGRAPFRPPPQPKNEEVELPPGWEAGGNPTRFSVSGSEWRAQGAGSPSTQGGALESGAWSPTCALALTWAHPSILPGGCGKWSYSVVPRTWEKYWVPLGSAHPAKPELAFPGPCPHLGRWPRASRRQSPGFSSASERYWPAGSPQVKPTIQEAKS